MILFAKGLAVSFVGGLAMMVLFLSLVRIGLGFATLIGLAP